MARIRKPLTEEQKARKKEILRAWRARNAAHCRRYQKATRDERNARRRRLYRAKSATERARTREWKRRNPDRVREYNRLVTIPQSRKGGRYDWRKYRNAAAWRKWVRTCAANRGTA